MLVPVTFVKKRAVLAPEMAVAPKVLFSISAEISGCSDGDILVTFCDLAGDEFKAPFFWSSNCRDLVSVICERLGLQAHQIVLKFTKPLLMTPSMRTSPAFTEASTTLIIDDYSSYSMEDIFTHLRVKVLKEKGPQLASDYKPFPGDDVDSALAKNCSFLPRHLQRCVKIQRMAEREYQINDVVVHVTSLVRAGYYEKVMVTVMSRDGQPIESKHETIDLRLLLQSCAIEVYDDEQRKATQAIFIASKERISLVDKVKKVFEAADVDKSGFLSKNELKIILQTLDQRNPLTGYELDSIFWELDADRNLQIDYNEFVDWVFKTKLLQDFSRNSSGNFDEHSMAATTTLR